MHPSFDQWIATFAETRPFEDLRGSVLAIEAAEYISFLMRTPPSIEPLLPALGGLPFTMKVIVQNDIHRFRDLDITPYFVFSGLDVGKNPSVFSMAEESAYINAEAWNWYNQQQAERAVDDFGNSHSIKSEDLFSYLQTILKEEGVNFLVAPYSAWAQLAYMVNQTPKIVDAICGSSELFFFNVGRVITNWDSKRENFSWVSKKCCLERLGNISEDIFIDACLLSGSKLLPSFPVFESPVYRKQLRVKVAVDIINECGRDGNALCLQHADDPPMRVMNYLDRFRRSRTAIKHHIILTVDGKCEPLNSEDIPNDLHDVIGQRLPDELYFYLSKGVIGTRVLNWRTSWQIFELPPIDGGESEEYRDLISNKLSEIRSITLALLSRPLTRFYQHKNVMLKCWFDKANSKAINVKEAIDVSPKLQGWNVPESLFNGLIPNGRSSGIIFNAVKCLSDPGFIEASLNSEQRKTLSTKDEIMYNTIWRFLHVRGYLNDDHTLTPWGRVLASMLGALDDNHDLEEAALLATELLRYDLLNPRDMFPTYSGAPFRGSEADKKYALLISRVACLGKLRHNAIGFTGPLSRNMLGFHSMICSVRNSLRDIVEVMLTHMLLSGHADRNRNDFTELGLEMPFLLHNDCGLGIAVKSYLDEFSGSSNRFSPGTRKAVYERGQKEWFPHSCNFHDDVQKAFKLWDIVVEGIKSANSLVKNSDVFEEADSWLKSFR